MKNKKTIVITIEEAEEWAKHMTPLKVPKTSQRRQGECDNCADNIVCWGMDEPDREKIPQICKYS